MTDLVYETIDDELYATIDISNLTDPTKPKFGDTKDIPNTMHGTKEKVITGRINVGTHLKDGI
ncbi:MAG: hypothetical protein MUF42_15550 [Cytophagaceae bacterium]|jgi:hypothetical protein|nr:hypothetical protein [Cytophagaceae bacterium]